MGTNGIIQGGAYVKVGTGYCSLEVRKFFKNGGYMLKTEFPEGFGGC